MTKPQVCPKCKGWGQVDRLADFGGTSANSQEFVTCPVCNGNGVLWEFKKVAVITASMNTEGEVTK